MGFAPWGITRAAAGMVALALTLAACSYDLSSHPDSCEDSADCREGYRCHIDFCVEITGLVAGPGANGTTGEARQDGSTGTSGDADASSNGGTSANAGTGGVGAGPTPDGGSMVLQDAGLDAGLDAGTLGVDAGPTVAPYASCTSADDCNPGETCIVGGTSGVCGAPCATPAECPTLPGSFGATPTCDATGHCRLDCDPAFQWMLPLTCPAGMSCTGNFGERTCFPG